MGSASSREYKAGQEYTITNEADTISARVLEKTDKGSYIAEFDTDDQSDIFRHGETPLPRILREHPKREIRPFIKRYTPKKTGL